MYNLLNDRSVLRLVQIALAEDLSFGDITSEALIPAETMAHAEFIAKSSGIFCGSTLATMVFNEVDRGITYQWQVEDGAAVQPGAVIGTVDGPARGILTAERTALNFIQRMSGVATKTSEFVLAVQGTGATILDTRKTLPGWRLLDKYSVTVGGGRNHRMGLYDMVMIKDNHIAAHGSITGAVSRATDYFREQNISDIPVEVETGNLADVEEALGCPGISRIMFDNFDLEMIRQGVALVAGRCETEASGDVSMMTVRSIAETGVQFISVGAITHSATAMNISLNIT